MLFLEKSCQVLLSVENAKMLTYRKTEVNITANKNVKMELSKKGTTSFLITSKMKCYMCQRSHSIYKSLLAIDVEAWLKVIKELKLCEIVSKTIRQQTNVQQENILSVNSLITHYYIPKKKLLKRSQTQACEQCQYCPHI